MKNRKTSETGVFVCCADAIDKTVYHIFEHKKGMCMNVVKTCDGIITPEETIERPEMTTEPIEDLVCLLTMSKHHSTGDIVPHELDEQDVLLVLDDSNDYDIEENTDSDAFNKDNADDGHETDSDDEAFIDDSNYIEESAFATPAPITMRKTRHARRTNSTSRWLS